MTECYWDDVVRPKKKEKRSSPTGINCYEKPLYKNHELKLKKFSREGAMVKWSVRRTLDGMVLGSSPGRGNAVCSFTLIVPPSIQVYTEVQARGTGELLRQPDRT